MAQHLNFSNLVFIIVKPFVYKYTRFTCLYSADRYTGGVLYEKSLVEYFVKKFRNVNRFLIQYYIEYVSESAISIVLIRIKFIKDILWYACMQIFL